MNRIHRCSSIAHLMRRMMLALSVALLLPSFARADDTLDHANAYLQALRDTPNGLTALADLTGESLPADGPLTNPQMQWLITQLFNPDGSYTLAYTNPTAAAQAVPPGDTYLQTLRQTSGAMTSLQDLTGKSR